MTTQVVLSPTVPLRSQSYPPAALIPNCSFFFFNDPPPPEISPLPLHAALPTPAALDPPPLAAAPAQHGAEREARQGGRPRAHGPGPAGEGEHRGRHRRGSRHPRPRGRVAMEPLARGDRHGAAGER